MREGTTTLTPEELAEAHSRIDAIRDEDIDYSDVPPIRDRSTSVRINDYPSREAAREAARKLYWAKRRAAE